jgi:glutamyl-tRNA synthetase
VSQAERAPRHREQIERLLAGGHAYEDEGAVRLRVPDEGETVVEDVIRGAVSFPHEAIDDFVIARSDGSALYNLAVAVDDLDMGITHVVRGADHLSNTPRQAMILKALGASPPVYAHLPLLHGTDHKKLSKRHGAASVQELREAGYLPEAVRNYIALLGWGLDASTTFMTTEQLIGGFSLERVSKSPAIFDEQKLRWMNGRYMRELAPAELSARLEERLGRRGLEEAATVAQDKLQTLDDFWPLAGFLVERQPTDERSWDKVMGEGAHERLEAAREALASLEAFDQERVEGALRGLVESLGIKPKEVFQPLRVAIAGSTVSPGIFESVVALGRDETLARVDDALARLGSGP